VSKGTFGGFIHREAGGGQRRALRRTGHRLVVPAIADYEVRRELERAGRTEGLASLEAWNSAAPDRYLPLSDSALRLASKLWAQARNAGTPTADPRELDCAVTPDIAWH
jgi:predicted nucleic acid-binding protein